MSFSPYFPEARPATPVDLWPGLTMDDIIKAFAPGTFSKKGVRLRASLLQEMACLDQEKVVQVLREASERKMEARSAALAASHSSNLGQDLGCAEAVLRDYRSTKVNTSNFMDVPDLETVKDCHREYLRRTSNEALARCVCQSCARILWRTECKLYAMLAIPNKQLLKPKHPHPAHELHEGMLVVPDALETLPGQGDEPEPHGYVCRDCLKFLDCEKPSLPPLSLSNGMWVGTAPAELRELTVPEQLLISINHPRFFIFKLSPKGRFVGDETKKQRGMKGTVTTFPLNPADVSKMLEGGLLPRPPAFLASVIGISFVGVGKVPKDLLRGNFRVRRKWVQDALVWLQKNNKFYRGMKISEKTLSSLPDDDVPEELVSVVRHEPVPGLAEREAASYVPNSEDEDEDDEDAETAREMLGAFSDREAREQADDDDNEATTVGEKTSGGPDVVPLKVLGCIDSDTGGMSNADLLKVALANSDTASADGPYAIRFSWDPVSEFPPQTEHGTGQSNSEWVNHIASCYPTLFPYGEGGIEDPRQVKVSYTEHARALMRRQGRAFCTHHSFPFMVFSVIQKRQLMSSAKLQMSQATFNANAQLISSLRPEDLKEAESDEENKRPNTNPKVRALRNQIYATSSRVMASNESRASYRSQIWGTTLVLRPPSLWMTLNLSDSDEPVVQILCGENIDMDKFDKFMGPDSDERTRNVAKNPLAAAEGFHFLINIILESLVGVTKTGKSTKSRTGVLGNISAYFGVVEAQGRGTLHLHTILWLVDAPNTDEMQSLLDTDAFREKMKAYISTMIRADIPGVNSAEKLKEMKKESEVAYSRPPNPDSSTYEDDRSAMEFCLARAQQVHTCKRKTCLQYDKFRRLKCKRRAPFPLSDDAFVNADGTWGIRRVYGYLNSWCPNLICDLRSNHDLKVTTNGADTRDGTFYITNYATKNQNRSYNWSAITAKAYLFHQEKASEERSKSLKDRNRLLLFRAVNLQNRQQEISAPQAMSYVYGWGDIYRSHHYTPIYSAVLRREIQRGFPEVFSPPRSHTSSSSEIGDVEKQTSRLPWTGEVDAGSVRLEVGSDERLTTRTQADDYKFRGNEFEDFGYLCYFLNSYEESVSRSPHAEKVRDGISSGSATTDSKRGRKSNDRVDYRSPHAMEGIKQRVVRTVGHNTLPSIVGPFFPRPCPDLEGNDDEFFATCLALLKPWRVVTDLKSQAESWKSVFDEFTASACRRDTDVVAGIRYYYQCRDTASKKAEEESQDEASGGHDEVGSKRRKRDQGGDEELNAEDGGEDLDEAGLSCEITEEILADVIASSVNKREDDYGTQAVETARLAGFFSDDSDRVFEPRAKGDGRSAEGADFSLMEDWKETLAAAGNGSRVEDESGSDEDSDRPRKRRKKSKRKAKPDVVLLGALKSGKKGYGPEGALSSANVNELMREQRRVFDIITEHAKLVRQGQSAKQLLLLVLGEGGVGKSKVIQTITDWFDSQPENGELVKGSYTGIASSLIDGKTLHSLCAISASGGAKRALSGVAQKNLEEFWSSKTHFIIDEVSMVSKSMLSAVDRRIALAREKSTKPTENGAPFGGVNVILFGDFHQFPPVAGSPLYARSKPGKEGDTASGGMIYEQFESVVILREQVRVTDEKWLQILRHARTGSCTREERRVIRSLILGNPDCPDTDLTCKPWCDAVLITPRHSVRVKWNQNALEEHAYREGRRIFVSVAEDTVQGRPLSMVERFAVHLKPKKSHNSKGGGSQDRNGLPWKVELAVGMKVMVTFNVDTELDLANGVRGEVFDIIFDDDTEGDTCNGIRTNLGRPPLCVLVKLHRTKAPQLKGLPENVVPIFPMRRTFAVYVGKGKRTVARVQFPITGAYAFTDYRSQGQTVERVIVDIGKPPGKDVSPFGAYVALSRSRGAQTIRLLRDFSDELFTTHPSEQLREEDERLELLAKKTDQEWSEILSQL